ncbi:hypothetical protein K450DRAFT_278450 [Umbelopsis ramanniana AG]|uniref:Fe2OG dioxygenase domain-containing protein n=1 Tax=Umbelopsis ramanniana AG TaxID=1314678 RepID=A0AAD5EF41_UMBRA|nr:uncharacterized protein K450DRAFT_278450 [Umbelopsis ramanniana AG]KAI8582064.1 hypothetical protein K450DRAFT_278450 [Umbelopsis ramanniana AG]
MATLPILDLSLFLSNSPEDKAAFVHNLQDAVLKYGFFYLKNAPSLTPELQDKALKQAKAFFALPLEEKLKIEMINSPHFRGYQRLGAETTNFKQDNREQIDYGMEVPAENMTDETPAYLGLKGPNQWPDVPGFKDTIKEYMNACCEIAKTLMRAVAISLDLGENHFAKFEHEPHVRMKVVRYPPMGHATDKPHEHGLGVGPHKDYGCLTILLQDDVGGLQVQGMDGVWIDAKPLPGCLVINIGEMFERMTQKTYVATVHRVLNNTSGKDRLSLPVFFNPNVATQVPVLQVPEYLLASRPKDVQSDVKEEQLLQYPVYGESAFRGLSRSHPMVASKWYSYQGDVWRRKVQATQ